MYIHEEGVLPDRFNVFGEAVDIFYGKKIDISLNAGIFSSTSNFKELDFEVKQLFATCRGKSCMH